LMDVAHNKWWQISEVIFGIPLLAALVLQWIVPLSLPYGLLTTAVIFGSAVALLGFIVIVFARRELAKLGQPTDPGHPTSMLVTTGIFSISRNPIYLGAVCFLAGIALAINLPWVLILLLPALFACHYVLIAPEEKYLTAKFGEQYTRYAASVHRWFGHIR